MCESNYYPLGNYVKVVYRPIGDEKYYECFVVDVGPLVTNVTCSNILVVDKNTIDNSFKINDCAFVIEDEFISIKI